MFCVIMRTKMLTRIKNILTPRLRQSKTHSFGARCLQPKPKTLTPFTEQAARRAYKTRSSRKFPNTLSLTLLSKTLKALIRRVLLSLHNLFFQSRRFLSLLSSNNGQVKQEISYQSMCSFNCVLFFFFSMSREFCSH